MNVMHISSRLEPPVGRAISFVADPAADGEAMHRGRSDAAPQVTSGQGGFSGQIGFGVRFCAARSCHPSRRAREEVVALERNGGENAGDVTAGSAVPSRLDILLSNPAPLPGTMWSGRRARLAICSGSAARSTKVG